MSGVIEKIDVEGPPSQCPIAQCFRISQSTVSRIIKSANFVLRKKRKIRKLTLSTTEKRHKRALRLYRQLANYRYRNFVTTDESWFYLDVTEGK